MWFSFILDAYCTGCSNEAGRPKLTFEKAFPQPKEYPYCTSVDGRAAIFRKHISLPYRRIGTFQFRVVSAWRRAAGGAARSRRPKPKRTTWVAVD
jgi:hypothetical protein